MGKHFLADPSSRVILHTSAEDAGRVATQHASTSRRRVVALVQLSGLSKSATSFLGYFPPIAYCVYPIWRSLHRN